ncbi:MAG: hypothetical protein IPI67_35795 [Myxococcales bacterium]|nr:hypothetical protein [Myxococcales bacterium]
MCLIFSIEALHDQRERLLAAAALASRDGIRVDVAHPSRWPWAQKRPVIAELTEDGACGCSLLADEADWNAPAWTLRSDVVPAIVSALRTLLKQGPPVLRVSALWAGDTPAHVERISPEQFLALVAADQLGTKTVYVVDPAA